MKPLKLSTTIFMALLTCSSYAQWKELTPELEGTGAHRSIKAIEVDAVTGDLFMTQKNSVWKRSSKDSPTWTRLDGNHELLGNLWYGISMVRDDETGALAIFRKDPHDQPVNSAYTLNQGEIWQPIKRVLIEGNKSNSYGWSWGVVDWNSEPLRMLARMHHSSRLWYSADAGENWTELSEKTIFFGFTPDGTILAAHPDQRTILSSSDNGKTWETAIYGAKVQARMPVAKNGNLYWLVESGLMVTKDNGRTWHRQGSLIQNAYWGPYFGKTENDIIVVTLDGVFRTDDAGETWNKVAENRAKELETGYGEPDHRFDWFIGQTTWGWDAQRNILYVAHGRLEMLEMEKQ